MVILGQFRGSYYPDPDWLADSKDPYFFSTSTMEWVLPKPFEIE